MRRTGGIAAPNESTDYQLQILDGFALRASGALLDVPTQSERLLALLAVHRRVQSRRHLATELWPESSAERATANLRSALWQLNKRCPGAVDTHQHRMRLGPAVSTDLWRVDDWCDMIRSGAMTSVPIKLGPIDVGELLPAWADEWLVLPRERHRLQWLQALEDFGQRSLQQGDAHSALETGLSLVAADPLRESAYYLLVSVFLAQRNRAQAMRCYADLAAVLDRELGVAPSRCLTEFLA